MSNKVISLGRCASAAAGITISAATNATPIVATIAPSTDHGLKNGDRISIGGVTGNTAANGDWTVSSIAAAAVTLPGSVGNGTYGGTPAVSVLMDNTPHMKAHAASCELHTAAFSGTVLVEGGTTVDSTNSVTDFADVKKGLALSANQSIGGFSFEVDLKRYMRLRCSAYTSGGIGATLVA